MAEKIIIKELETQIAALISDHKRLSELNADLNAQCEKLMVERRELQERVAELTGDVSSLRLSVALSGKSDEKNKARARVNQLMREVDRCIALLNKVENEA